MSHPMMASKMSSTPCAQDAQLVKGGWLSSKSSRYRVQSFLGEGTFGKVAKCTRIDDMKTVAIKMIKKNGDRVEQANAEVAMLERLKSLNMDKHNLVEWYQVFTNRGYICLEFELLDKSLYDFMKESYFRPLLLKEIRPIVQQLASVLDHLKAVGIIHADLKLENVMLVDHRREPYRVKVIDFGLACDVSTATVGSYVQSRPYRAPEIILGLPFTEAIDMWSLGCMATAMYIGTLLYPGSCQYDVMRYMVETQGQPPDHLLTFGYNTTSLFQRNGHFTTSLWKLKTPEQIYKDTGIQSKETRRLKLTSLDDILHIRTIKAENSADKAAAMADVLMFVDLLKGMLQLDAAKRITPHQVLAHPFISMRHMNSMYTPSYHVRSCFKMMEACCIKTSTSDSGKTVCGSSQQPHSSTASVVNKHPYYSNQTTHSDRSGVKRKVDDEDVNNTSHPSKKIKSVINDSQCRPADSAKTHLTQSSQTQSWVRSSLKRRLADSEDSERQKTRTRHYERSDYDRKRFREDSTGLHTSSCGSKTRIHVSLRVKRRMAHGEDSGHYEKLHHEERRAPKWHAGRSNRHGLSGRSRPAEHHRHSARPSCSTQAESRGQSELKRKAHDEEDVQPRKRAYDPWRDNDRRRHV